MQNYYLAVDIGASGGRHILGSLDNGKLQLEEIYRFENGLIEKEGYLCWDLDQLFQEILNGLKKCKAADKIPVSMGVDTWGVDFVLLDTEDKVLGPTVGYRDKRTAGMDDEVYKIIKEEQLYHRTGIQKQIFNTIYQLTAVKTKSPEILQKAEALLMIPDYFHFLLTGKKAQEYTNATTGQLVNPVTKDWDYALLDKLGIKKEIFQKISLPKTSLGNLRREIKEEIGFDCEIVLPATHDTGSAVLAVPASDDDYLYISSGTWSLIGIERMEADCREESRLANFTNEGGYDYRFRYLKNIMGLWMIQSVRHELEDKYSFAELCAMAEESSSFPSIVDVNAPVFLAPDNMTQAIKDYLKASGQKVPETIGELAACIYNSLAASYSNAVKEIEALTGRSFRRIHIVGGGSNADYLNQLTADHTGKDVCTGPSEATALGNILAQMLKTDVFEDIIEARKCVYDSFGVRVFNSSF
ncbi:rhamnulokinase [Anaerocolumna sp. AGMB13020]|uniref:rhamnulokinase n=1 Tax=Anaerocolumna sp. AGMB13020 TaxID=3081750 RepID=UPI0029547A0F|nr:rhamnulokinase [Anaerocolumna sp. AGMB13020]WOO39131.1 rhamnulokinase [Anaerocolumna sp. AGMB13020]